MYASRLRGRLLEIGPEYPQYYDAPSIKLDLCERYGHGKYRVDVVGDACALPFRDGSFSTVVCLEVMEHVTSPERLLSELSRVLRSGGTLFFSVPMAWLYHPIPLDRLRLTSQGVEAVLQEHGFRVVKVHRVVGVLGFITTMLYFMCMARINRVPLNPLRRGLLMLNWLLFLPAFILSIATERLQPKDIYITNFCVAEKP
ncbi:MAG: class I SAM-dependent methyltransferase [Euryarchaeota archaeon]|nr:class I SAM-dependent methyltransferase [Euryarchaeota archaeon]